MNQEVRTGERKLGAGETDSKAYTNGKDHKRGGGCTQTRGEQEGGSAHTNQEVSEKGVQGLPLGNTSHSPHLFLVLF
jgi:hypothetical protein